MLLELCHRDEYVGLLVAGIDVEGGKEESAPGNLEAVVLRKLAAIAGILELTRLPPADWMAADVPAAAAQHLFRRFGRVLAFQHDHPPVCWRRPAAAQKCGHQVGMGLVRAIAGHFGQLPRPARDVDLDDLRLIADEASSARRTRSRAASSFLRSHGRIVAAATLDGDRGCRQRGGQIDAGVVNLLGRFRVRQTAGGENSGGTKTGNEKLTLGAKRGMVGSFKTVYTGGRLGAILGRSRPWWACARRPARVPPSLRP